MACIDERSKVYPKQGYHTIFHLALENDNYYFKVVIISQVFRNATKFC